MAKEAKTKICYLLAIIFTFLIYFVLNRSLTPRFMPGTIIDDLVPYTPVFGIFYSSYFIFIGLWVGYAFLNFSQTRYCEFAIALIGIQIVAYAIYIVFPAKILRPVVGEGIFEHLVEWIYFIDNPTNLTPSLHVANSVLLAMFMHRVKTLRILVWIWATLIVISTLAIKQHYVVDVVTGVLLSTLGYWCAERFMAKRG